MSIYYVSFDYALPGDWPQPINCYHLPFDDTKSLVRETTQYITQFWDLDTSDFAIYNNTYEDCIDADASEERLKYRMMVVVNTEKADQVFSTHSMKWTEICPKDRDLNNWPGKAFFCIREECPDDGDDE